MEMRRSCGQGRSLGAPRGPSASYSHRSTTSYHEVDTSTALDRMAAPVDLWPAMRDVRLTPFCQDDRRFAKCQDLRKEAFSEDGRGWGKSPQLCESLWGKQVGIVPAAPTRRRGAPLAASCLIRHQRDELRWVKCLDKGRNGGWTSRPPSIRLGNWHKEVLFFSMHVHMQPAVLQP